MCALDHRPSTEPRLFRTVDTPGADDPVLAVHISTCRSASDSANRQPPESLHVAITGELDAYSAGHVTDDLCEIVDSASELVLDGSRITFVDSAGLRAIEAVRDRIVHRDGRVWMHDMSTCLGRLVDIVGFDDATFCRSRSPGPVGASDGRGHHRCSPRSDVTL